MRFYLIPVSDALPAIEAHFKAFPDDGVAPTPEELRKLVRIAFAFVPVSERLLEYARALGGKPSRN